MKKIFTPLFALITIASSAQITITKADMPVANDTIRVTTANTSGVADPSLTGANYTWDYSALVPTIQNKDTFVSVSSTPYVYQFYFNDPFDPYHKATVARRFPGAMPRGTAGSGSRPRPARTPTNGCAGQIEVRDPVPSPRRRCTPRSALALRPENRIAGCGSSRTR